MEPWCPLILLPPSDSISPRLYAEIVVAALLTGLLYGLHRLHPVLPAKIADRLHDSTRHTRLWIIVPILLALGLRLIFLPWLPPPLPFVHDEFGHLLVADTLLDGRLANPPHPLWRHLETIYVLQQPSYASIYPIGQGFILAAGKVLAGTPWAGVLLSVALMSGAIAWMLFGCLPPPWAALGGVLAALNYGLAPRWIDSYFGGSFCAFGGALLFGALCRLRQSPSRTMGLIAGIGWSVVWFIRPFESAFLLIFTWTLIAVFAWRGSRQWKAWIGPALLIVLVQASAGIITALHNRAVTGSPTTLPYFLSRQTQGVPQSFLGQPPVPEPATRITEVREMYWWQRRFKEQPLLDQAEAALFRSWDFFITPWYSLPFVLALFLWKDRTVLVCAGMVMCSVAAGLLYPFFFPYYIAAYSCIMMFLIMQGLMRLSQWSIGGRAAGQLVVVFLVLGGSMMALRFAPATAVLGLRPAKPRDGSPREQVVRRLEAEKGLDVVFVSYTPNHSFQDEWVYNAADIDDSPIVWCREMGPVEDREVLDYYRNRRAWTLEVGRDSVHLSEYKPALPLAARRETR